MTTKDKAASGFKLIGWQGTELQVPEDWTPIAESGGKQEGLIRLVSSSYNFEIKWEKAKEKKEFSLESVKDKFIESMQKSSEGFQLLKKGFRKVSDHNTFYFHFKEEKSEGYGLGWYCEKSRKVFLSMFAFKPAEYKKSKLILKHLLDSFRCHASEDWDLWSLFGFSFKTPSNFELKKRRFLVGHVTLVLSDEELHPFCVVKTEAALEYWSPANVKFEKTYKNLEEWFEQHYEKEFKKLKKGRLKKGEFQSFTIQGHEGKNLTSTTKRGLFMEQTISKNNTYMWYCPNTNRIYALTLSKALNKYIRFLPTKKYETPPTETFNKILASFSCH